MTYKEYRTLILMETKQALKVQNDYSYPKEIREQAHYIVITARYDIKYYTYTMKNMNKIPFDGKIYPFYKW